MQTLPSFLRLNDARRYKAEYLASLSAFEVEVMDLVLSGGHCFGARPRKSNGMETVVLTPCGKKAEDKVVAGAQETLNKLVRKGWLRYAGRPHGDTHCGYFWATDAAERLWRVLGREVRD